MGLPSTKGRWEVQVSFLQLSDDFSSGEPIMHVDKMRTGLMDLQEAPQHFLNSLKYWTLSALQRKVWMSEAIWKMGHIDNYDIESLPMGGESRFRCPAHQRFPDLINNGS